MTQENERNWRSFRQFREDAARTSRVSRDDEDTIQSQVFCSPGINNAAREFRKEFREERRNANGPFQSQTICSPGVNDASCEFREEFREERRNANVPFQSQTFCAPGVDNSPRGRREKDLRTASVIRRRFNGVQRRGERAKEERWILFVDGVDFCFNWIPAGRFSMGFKENEQFDCCEQCEGCAIGLENRSWKANETESWKEKPECCYIVPDSEASRHNVVITRDFWLMDTPVTVAAFDVFLKKTGRALNGGAYGYDAKTNSIVWKEEFNFENPGFPDFEVSRFKQSYPASCISWKEAVDFCEWLTEEVNATEKLKGRRRFQGVLKFRLPTEAEWERACRAGTKTSYFFGDESERLPTFGNFNGFDEYDDGYDYAAPVRRFVPNGYGLCDMHGNIWEWCADWYAPYEPGLLIAAAARDPEGPFRGERRVVRGGAWNNAADSCRSATRGAAAPWVKAVNLGFRVAMDVCEY